MNFYNKFQCSFNEVTRKNLEHLSNLGSLVFIRVN